MATSRAAAHKLREVRQQEESLALEILQPGDAANYPSYGDTVGVHYIAYMDGHEFDNSYRRGQMFYFILGAGQVIPGW